MLLGLYAQGSGWAALGFIALVPWLRALDRVASLRVALLQGWAMSVAMMLAVFSWFGVAIGAFTGIGTPAGVAVLVALAPVLQPQLLVFGAVRVLAGRRHGPALRTLGAAAAWVAAEWALPDLLGDTLGHGLFPAAVLRQGADLGGAAGLTFALLLVNEAIVLALARWTQGGAARWRPIAVAILVPALMAGYGALRLHQLAALDRSQPATPLRVGLVQANITGYERLREQLGAYAVVRKVLDTHYAMSRELLATRQVDALLWSETVYPTTFGTPKSAGGAELDAELGSFVRASGVPLVFGTYDRDAAGGEYNSAAFVEASGRLLGHYRKARPFPLTEFVPAWLDGPLLRRWLPWAGTWRAGDGARVFPLRLADGREVPVLPLVCLDDTDPRLAIDGARLGAQAILGMSNDSWFTHHPIGARLHLAVAGFRSIETRLPQLRVTANGISASLSASGDVLAQTAMDQRALLVGEVAAHPPLPTLMVAWGNWVGPVALAGLLLLGLLPALGKLRRPGPADALTVAPTPPWPPTRQAAVMPVGWRRLAALLQAIAGLALLALFGILLLRDDVRANPLWSLRLAAALVLAPALATWCIRQAFSARLAVADGVLRIRGHDRETQIPLASLRALQPWWLPWPGQGVWVELQSGRRWREGVVVDGDALARALSEAGTPVPLAGGIATRLAQARWRLRRWWFDRLLVKYALLPLVPALLAFRLHQHIAYGGTFGEYQTYGLGAYLLALALWWASWALGSLLFGALLALLVEGATLLVAWLKPSRAIAAHAGLHWIARLLYFVVAPACLLARALGA